MLKITENKITKDKIVENVAHLEITEVMLVYCKVVNNDYQQDSWVLYTFVPNKPLGKLLENSTTNFILLKTIFISNSEFSYIEVWFTDQNSQPLEIVDWIISTLVIKWYSYYKNALFNWTKR